MTKFQEEIFRKYKAECYWPKPILKNECISDIKGKPKKFELNPTQTFVGKFVQPKNDNGLLLYHSVGSGKTLSAVNILSNFEKQGYHTLWVTRTTLKKDLQKALLQVPLKKPLFTISYKQFSNIGKHKGENYNKLAKRTGNKDPLYKTVVVIDEVHKLYTKDLKAQEMHEIQKIQDMIHDSYKGSTSPCKVILMSATPITENSIEVIQLLNLIIQNAKDRFNVNTFKSDYLDSTGKFTKESADKFSNKISDLVSFIDMSKDPRKFTQVEYTEVLVPLSSAEGIADFEKQIFQCNMGVKFCKELGFSAKACNEKGKECVKEVKEKQKLAKSGKYQLKLLNEKCDLHI